MLTAEDLVCLARLNYNIGFKEFATAMHPDMSTKYQENKFQVFRGNLLYYYVNLDELKRPRFMQWFNEKKAWARTREAKDPLLTQCGIA